MMPSTCCFEDLTTNCLMSCKTENKKESGFIEFPSPTPLQHLHHHSFDASRWFIHKARNQRKQNGIAVCLQQINEICFTAT
jgi:hypothetical protein